MTSVMGGSVRPARTFFLRVKVPDAPDSGKHVANRARVKVPDAPDSGKHVANRARVSAVRRNLKEA